MNRYHRPAADRLARSTRSAATTSCTSRWWSRAPPLYYDDKTLPSLPASVLNVMQAGRASNRPLVTSPESATEQMAIPFDYVVNGSYSLKITVK